MTARRRLNLKFAICLVAGVAVFGVAAHFVHGFQAKRNANAFLAQAERAMEAGKLSEAADELSRYLALVPDNDVALAKYGLLLADEKLATSPRALLRAYFVLEQALRRDAERHDVRRRVIQVAMNPWLSRFGDAGKHLENLLKTFPKDGELHGLQARCHEANGKYEEARDSFEKALKYAPKEVETYARLASLLRQHPAKVRHGKETVQDILQQADLCMDEMVSTNDRSFQAYLMRAGYRKQVATPATLAEASKAAAEDILKAKQLAPLDVDVILAVAELARESKNSKEARDSLLEGIKQSETDRLNKVKRSSPDWRMYQALARLEVHEGQAKDARKALENGLKQFPKQIDLLWNLAHLLIQEGDKARTTETIKRLRDEGFPAADLEYLDARVLITEEKWLRASQLLEHAYPQLLSRNSQFQDWFSLNLAMEANLLLGRCYEQLGDPDRAAAAYGRVITREPQSIPARLGVARMQWAMGRLDAARTEYEQLLLLPHAPGSAWIDFAQLMIVRNLRTTQPEWAEVNRILDQAAKLTPPPVEVAILRAEALVAQKDLTQARKVLVENHADPKARPVEIWVSMSGLAEREDKSTTALSLLDEAQKHLGDLVDLRLARARYWARHPGDKARTELTALAWNPSKFKEADQRRLLRGLAAAYQQLGEPKDAVRLWRQVAMQQQNDLSSRMTLLDLAVQAGDRAAINDLMHDLKLIEGDEGTLWRYASAVGLLFEAEKTENKVSRKKTLDQARDLLEIVAKRRSGWSRVFVAQGQISDMLGHTASALAKYQQAVVLGDRNPVIIRRAIDLLSRQGRHAEVGQLFQKLSEQPTTGGDLAKLGTDIALRKGDMEEALRLAKKAISAGSKDYRDHLWYARVLWVAGQPEDAETWFRRAVAQAPQNPEPRVAYIQYLIQTDKTDKKESARAKIQEAEQELPKDKATLPLAVCYDLLGDKEQALKLYTAARAANPDDVAVLRSLALFHLRDNRRDEAKLLFLRIIDLKATKPSEAASARRALALVFSSTGDYQQAQKGLELLGLVDEAEQLDPTAPPSAENQRARLAILATQTNLRQRRQAVAILEDLRRRGPLELGERFLLVQLNEAIREERKAHGELMSLLATVEELIEKTPAAKAQLEKTYCGYLAHACQGSLRQKKLDEAALWVTRLEKLEPGTFRTLALKAHLSAKTGNADAAVASLKALTRENEKLLLPVGSVLEQIGQHAEAQELYEKHVKQSKRPEDVLILATFFGRRNLPEKALTVCERAWQTCSPEAVSNAAVTVLYTSKPSEGQSQQVVRWLEDAIQKNPKKTLMLEDLAAVRRLQGRYQDAVAIYRRILEQNDEDALTLNNLAWLLALTEGKGAEALKFIDRAIDIGGPVTGSLDTRAVVRLSTGDHKRAIDDLKEVVADMPTAHHYFHLAQAYHQANNRQEAVNALRQAKSLGLTESMVDPLEVPAYRQVIAALDRR